MEKINIFGVGSVSQYILRDIIVKNSFGKVELYYWSKGKISTIYEYSKKLSDVPLLRWN